MKTLLTALLVATLAAGCAVSSGPESQLSKGDQKLARYEGYIGAPIRGFTAMRQQSWQSVSRTQFILWTSTRDAHLITIAGSCPDLMFANAIHVTSTVNEISTFEWVHVGRDRCPIEKIQPIDIRQMRADEKELRKDKQN